MDLAVHYWPVTAIRPFPEVLISQKQILLLLPEPLWYLLDVVNTEIKRLQFGTCNSKEFLQDFLEVI